MRCHAVLLVLLTGACGGSERDHGPPPPADHEALVRSFVDDLLGAKYELENPSAYRFSKPSRDRVARWLFEPHEDGEPHEFGYRYGWRVDFWVKPDYVGYPEQPESRRMAFFGDGKLRGIFSAGGNAAPLALDAWSPMWVDESWQPEQAAGAATPR